MISAQVIIDPPVLGLIVTGHAGYNPGNDPVCSAVSAVVYTLLGWLENNPKAIEHCQPLIADEGNAKILLRGDDQAAAVFQAAAIGLGQIEQKYPGHLRVQMDV